LQYILVTTNHYTYISGRTFERVIRRGGGNNDVGRVDVGVFSLKNIVILFFLSFFFLKCWALILLI